MQQKEKRGLTGMSNGEADFTDPKIHTKFNSDFEYLREAQYNHMNMVQSFTVFVHQVLIHQEENVFTGKVTLHTIYKELC